MTNRVIVELRAPFGISMEAIQSMDIATQSGFNMDFQFRPVPVNPHKEIASALEAANEETILLRGELEEAKEIELKALPKVVNVWTDALIEPFVTDCDFNTAKGTIEDVAKYLCCDQLCAKDVTEKGIVIGICDTRVNKKKIPVVICGWSPYPNSPLGKDIMGHGSMCAIYALGMCLDAKIYV